jgi:alanine-glyoxylate transaminase/serine-glyoxylate transaminase/serine-pyruvate transaminase
MTENVAPRPSGRHFLQIPGPTNLPDRIARAMARPTIDHRGPEFKQLTGSLLERIRAVFQTEEPVIIYPSSGTGAWEAALVNTCSPGDHLLICDNGHFASLWTRVAERLGLQVGRMVGQWRQPVDLAAVESRLAEDRAGHIKAVALVHNETSTGVVNDVAGVRRALDAAGHDALLLVDVVSSLACMDYRHGEWGVDVTVAGSQKGLMLPPGLGFNAISPKALAAAQQASLPRAYWEWQAVLTANQSHTFPYTPATNLLFALDESLAMLFEEGLEQTFARHASLAEATRRAVQAWGLEVFCQSTQAYSSSLTAVLMPTSHDANGHDTGGHDTGGHDADALRELILQRFNMSLGTGLGQAKGKLFRIGHLGEMNDLTLMGTLCGVEMGLGLAGVPHAPGGVLAAMDYLAQESQP